MQDWTEWDDGRNPQFLLFANGEVIQGMDINHREVLVRENAKAGEKIQFDLQSYTGTLHSEFRLLADLEEHDKKIEEIYYDLIVPMQGLNRMDEDSKNPSGSGNCPDEYHQSAGSSEAVQQRVLCFDRRGRNLYSGRNL